MSDEVTNFRSKERARLGRRFAALLAKFSMRRAAEILQLEYQHARGAAVPAPGQAEPRGERKSPAVVNVTWKGPEGLSVPDAYILAVYLRLEASGGKTMGDRNFVPPTLLTAKRVKRIARVFAYMRDMIRAHRLETIALVDEFVEAHAVDEAEAWMEKNDAKIEAARRDLVKLLGKFVCYG